jgi:hypothetical protein
MGALRFKSVNRVSGMAALVEVVVVSPDATGKRYFTLLNR